MAQGASARLIQPDPVLTNIMQDNSAQGGWLAPILCPVKAVPKDYVRYATQDAKTLLTNFAATMRAPGGRANLLPRPIKAWLTAAVTEDAVRVEYTQEDVENSMSPEEPAANAAMKILNALQYAIESRVAVLFHPDESHFTANVNKAAATGAWASTTARMAKDVTAAAIKVLQNTGNQPNYIRIPMGKWAGILDSDELKNNPSGFFNNWLQGALSKPGMFPDTFMGLKLLLGAPRYDATMTGALSPAFVWDDATYDLDDTVHVGYSPTLNGQAWSGEGNTFCGQFENQIDGSAFEARSYESPYFVEDHTTIVTGNVRRSDPTVFNANSVFAITGI